MNAWKILVADQIDIKGLEILRANAQVNDCSGISATELHQIISEFDALIVRSRTIVNASILMAASRLRVIGRAGVGVDNIDLQAARSKGIIVVNAPIATSIAVAELTIGFMLSLARRIPNADLSMKLGKWEKKGFAGQELHGKTLGVIGIGNIGRTVAAYAAALGMHVLAHDPLQTPESIRERSAQPVSLDELYALSDYITLHAPLNAETDTLVDEQALSRMKPGVYILCTARGGLIDETALLAALERQHVAGAALDVYAHEPPGRSPLVSHPRVIATPHIGAQTPEAQERAAVDIAQEVLAALRGDPLRWQVV